jgi:hypothetical protein
MRIGRDWNWKEESGKGLKRMKRRRRRKRRS